MSSRPSPSRTHVINATLLLAGMAATVVFWPPYPVRDPATVIAFAGLGIATNLFLIPYGTSVVSLSDAVFLAASIVLGPPAGAMVMIASVTAGAINRGPTPPRIVRVSNMLGNYGMYMLMMAAATWAYTRLGGPLPLTHLSGAIYAAAAGFIVVYQAINRLVMYSRTVLLGESVREQLQEEPEIMPIEVMDLHIGILIALAYVHDGWGPLVIFGVAILLISLVLRRRISMSEQLQRQVTQLGALNEIGRAISATMETPRLIEAIYRESSKVIDATNFYIALYAAEQDEVTFALDVMGGQRATPQPTRRGGQGLTEYVIRTRAPLLLPDNAMARARALGIEPTGTPPVCWVGVPMIASSRVVGVIAARNYTTANVFTPEHVNILMTIAAQAAIAIENARLLEAVAEQERLRQELALARAIQQSLLPDSPKIPGLFIVGRCLPAQETSGDLFDFAVIDEHHLGIAIGDVVGKGMPAALLMATARSLLRAYAQRQLDPAVVLEAVNRVLYDDTRGKTYVSMCYVVLDTRAWTLTVANAGHPSPLMCGRRGEPTYLETPYGLPLGAISNLHCADQVYPLLPGQALLLYTDGVVEAHDAHRQLLGFGGLQVMVAHQPGERLVDTILEGVAQFTGPVALQDDLTLVVVQRVK